MTPKPWENGEGYPDPTAYNALRPIMQEDAALEGKVNFLIKGAQVYHSGKRL